MKTVAAVACTNYDNLINDVTFIGSLIGQPNIAQSMEGSIAAITEGKGLAGVDKTKPWGLILQTDGMQFLPVVCLPSPMRTTSWRPSRRPAPKSRTAKAARSS